MKRGIIDPKGNTGKELGKDLIFLVGGLLAAGTALIGITDKIGKKLTKEKDENKNGK